MQITPFKYCSGLVLVLMFFQLAQAKPSQRNHEKFDIKIEEKGTEFRQEVDIDDDDGIVTVHVPSHNDIDETIFITDTIKHLTMRVAPQQKMCFLTKNDPEELPPAAVWRKTKDSVQSSKIHEAETKKEKITYAITGSLKNHEKEGLDEKMKARCDDFPIMWVEPIYGDLTQDGNMVFINDSDKVQHGRFKRQIPDSHGSTHQIPDSNEQKAEGGNFFLDECNQNRKIQMCLRFTNSCYYVFHCDSGRDPQGRDAVACDKKDHLYSDVVCCHPCCKDEVPEGNYSPYCYSTFTKHQVCPNYDFEENDGKKTFSINPPSSSKLRGRGNGK